MSPFYTCLPLYQKEQLLVCFSGGQGRARSQQLGFVLPRKFLDSSLPDSHRHPNGAKSLHRLKG